MHKAMKYIGSAIKIIPFNDIQSFPTLIFKCYKKGIVYYVYYPKRFRGQPMVEVAQHYYDRHAPADTKHQWTWTCIGTCYLYITGEWDLL